MSWKPEVDEIERLRALARQQGGAEAVGQQHARGRLTVRERVGMPDVTLQYTMDYDLFLRMARASDPLVIDDVLSRFRIHGTSKSGTTIRKRFDEHDMVVRRHAPPAKPGLMLVARFHTIKTVFAYRLMWMMGMLGKG